MYTQAHYIESTRTYICAHRCTHSHFVPEKLEANMHKHQFNIKGCIFYFENTKYCIMKTSITLSLLANEEQRIHF